MTPYSDSFELHGSLSDTWRQTPPETPRSRRVRHIIRCLIRLYRSLGIRLCRHRMRALAMHWEHLSTAPIAALETFLTEVLLDD